jgi:transcriptional regulator PpsR
MAQKGRNAARKISPFRTRTLLSVTSFRFAEDCFAALDADGVASLLAHASDLTLVLDAQGVVRDLSVPNPELSAKLTDPQSWVGTQFVQLLSPASRAKAALLLADANAGHNGKWHHLNQIGRDGADVPMLYSDAPLGPDGRVVVFGRDLRPLSLLQQRLVDAQHAMERDHGRLRQLELRYRLVLQSTSDPLMVVNVATQKVVELNPAMAALCGKTLEEITGQPAADLFASNDRARITALTAPRAALSEAPIAVTLADGTSASLAITPFRDDGVGLLLLRIHVDAGPAVAHLGMEEPASLLRLVDQAPDGYVVTDGEGRVIAANARFQSMTEVARPRDLVGQSLDRWLGRGGVDLDVLLNNIRQRGSVRLFATALTGASGLTTSVEVSAVGLNDGPDGAVFGFAVRDIERRVSEARPGREMPRSVDQLTELIGRVPLKDLVREATDMIERLCIEAALEMTRDNRASAAELLGLSRQSLYVKLHRYGLGDLAEAPN